jgi:hypothetical protein
VRPGVTTEGSDELKALRREVVELHRKSEILTIAWAIHRGRARSPTSLICSYIAAHADRFGVETPDPRTSQTAVGMFMRLLQLVLGRPCPRGTSCAVADSDAAGRGSS